MPILTGILLNSVGPYQRTVANALANLVYNLIGYLPAPVVYGLVQDLTGGAKSRYGIGVLMYSTIFSSAFLFAALICKLKPKKSNKYRRHIARRALTQQLLKVPED